MCMAEPSRNNGGEQQTSASPAGPKGEQSRAEPEPASQQSAAAAGHGAAEEHYSR